MAGLLAAPAAAAPPQIEYVPSNSHPPLPAGLKMTCMKSPNQLVPSATCPVVQIDGYTVWAYSFIDNRVSLALVTYDAKRNVVGNITKDGTRYIWEVIPDRNNSDGFAFYGQSNAQVTATAAELHP